MAVAMAAAAALGFLGASQASTSFAVAPASQLTAAPVASVRATAQPSHAAGASTSTSASLCAGAVLGMAGAAVSVKGKSRVAAKAGFDPTTSVGVLEPTGFWDPCGLMKERVGKDGWQWKDEATFNKYRVAELKHGRLAMMAVSGMIANTFWKFPGFETVPDGLKALQESQGGSGFGIIFLLAAGIELKYPDGKFPDPLKLGSFDNWGYTADMQNKEIANGRVAMSAVLTFWITEYGTKMSPAEQLADTNFLNFVAPALLLGFALGNPEGWKKGEYVPSIFATGGTLYPSDSKVVTISASLPTSVKETEKVKEEMVA